MPPSHTHCREYALAGNGLPAIERGMPDPAGTGLSRRSFLLRAAGVAMSVYGADKLAPQAIEEGIAAAAAGTQPPILVNVFFSGGLDSIGVLGQYEDGRYHDLRRQLADLGSRDPIPFNGASGWSWHPDAAILDELWRSEKLTILPTVGYTDPNQSHFTSRHFWEIGSTDIAVRTGWLGRYLDSPGVGDLTNPLQGLTMGASLMPALAAERMPVAAVESPSTYVFRTPGVWIEELEPLMHQALAGLSGTPSGADPVMAYAKSAQANASNLQTRLRELGAYSERVDYPGGRFGERLGLLAHMIESGMPIRCASVIANGDYDTHASQAAGFSRHLPTALGSLKAFQADLEARGIADRVLTFVWSEFGRRPEENGSGGTDHGAAAMGFVLGANAAGGIVGAMPDIAADALDRHGNLTHSIEMRDVYGTLLADWLKADVERVVPGARTDLALVAS